MNRIEEILENSVFSSNQFNSDQIKSLNEMVDTGLAPEVVGNIAYPGISDLTYRVLCNYLSSGKSIDRKEFNTYASIATSEPELNDIITNVFIGKMHELSDEQINLYIRSGVHNKKIGRLLVEKCKDLPLTTINKLVRTNINNTQGKILIQDFINNDIELNKLLLVIDYNTITDEVYNVLHQYSYDQIKWLGSEEAIKYNGANCSYLLKYIDKFEDSNNLEYFYIHDDIIEIYEQIASSSICSTYLSVIILLSLLKNESYADIYISNIAKKNTNIKLTNSDFELLNSKEPIKVIDRFSNNVSIVNLQLIVAYLEYKVTPELYYYDYYSIPEFIKAYNDDTLYDID